MRRREFIQLVGGAALAWPLATYAQQQPVSRPVIGFLCSGPADVFAPRLAALWRGLNEAGYVENKNVTMEYRWAEGQFDQLPTLAADLVRRQVNMIVTAGGGITANTAKKATSSIPIVFVMGADPERLGIVSGVNRPGGNLTGVSYLTNAIGPKRLSLLHDFVPNATVFAALVNPNNPSSDGEANAIEAAAKAVGQQLIMLHASSERDLEATFSSLSQQGIGAVVVLADPVFDDNREKIVMLATQYAVPTSFTVREFAQAGGLMSYGASQSDAYRQAGVYAGRVLKGEKPADLPVLQPTKFEFVINLKTAKALGLTVPPSIIAIADEVIE
jgi:putative tryptophan/tyrosine transport system substrate-binding protein